MNKDENEAREQEIGEFPENDHGSTTPHLGTIILLLATILERLQPLHPQYLDLTSFDTFSLPSPAITSSAQRQQSPEVFNSSRNHPFQDLPDSMVTRKCRGHQCLAEFANGWDWSFNGTTTQCAHTSAQQLPDPPATPRVQRPTASRFFSSASPHSYQAAASSSFPPPTPHDYQPTVPSASSPDSPRQTFTRIKPGRSRVHIRYRDILPYIYKNEMRNRCLLSHHAKSTDSIIMEFRILLSGENSDSVHFLRNIRKYNSCFQMPSFGAENQTHSVTFPTTFSIQGQVYHRIGSLMASENQPSRFLQIYFVGNDDDDDIQTDRRCQQIQGVRRNIVQGLQRMLHQHNLLVQQFKTALENLPSDTYRVVANADRTPPGQHPRRYNAPTANEVALS
ncbi:hypothetical protein LAZ67_19001839 [Cordylochernes scorpioides]|uniref:Helitron helicase-like domain-containing protein n=1 Tax=Cordylochernes scorpioides TaxID=51811 RepID=A0ABY6LJP2_9ARAC|nr:hypothetical protein LAZ67_19001839 [Cordylochernes scorpioides]